MASISPTSRPGYVYDSATDTWIPIGIGPHTHQATDLSGVVDDALIDAKGDLIVGSAADTPARLAVGNNGETLVADSSATTGLRWNPSQAAGKNAIINGGMDIWQRGTSFSQVSGYTADRWYLNASTTTTITRDTSVLTPNSQYSLKATATGTQQIFFYQAIETANAVNFAGKRVVLSGYVAGSSGVSTNINASLSFSTSTDVAVTGSYTDITPVSAGNITTTTSMQRVSAVFDVPSTAKSLRVLFVNNAANITNGQSLYLGDVQLELGSVASSFTRAGGTLAGELAACQRYYQRWGAQVTGGNPAMTPYGSAASTTNLVIFVPTRVPMRTTPSSLDYGGTLTIYDGVNTQTASSATLSNASADYVLLSFAGTGMTQYRPYAIYSGATNAYLGLNAEL